MVIMMIPRRQPGFSYRAHALRSLDQMPPLSPILSRLLSTLSQEDVSFAKLSGLIEQDAVLSANLLRLVNSAAYGCRGTVSSVRHAVSLIGLHKLRNAAMSLSIARLWTKIRTPAGWSAPRFNIHSAATAVLADLLALELPVEYPEGAFAAGLLHDLGRLLIAISLPDEYEEIAELKTREGKSRSECEQALLEVSHAELSAAALSKWNLPQPIVRAVEYHHGPEEPVTGDSLRALSSAVSAADGVAHSLGFGIELAEGDEEAAISAAILFGVDKDRAPALLDSFRKDFESIRAAY